jgi:hypothetical protein
MHHFQNNATIFRTKHDGCYPTVLGLSVSRSRPPGEGGGEADPPLNLIKQVLRKSKD